MAETTVRHNVNWHIQPSHLVAALAAAYVAWRFGIPFLRRLTGAKASDADESAEADMSGGLSLEID
jgi:hypothetical protein